MVFEILEHLHLLGDVAFGFGVYFTTSLFGYIGFISGVSFTIFVLVRLVLVSPSHLHLLVMKVIFLMFLSNLLVPSLMFLSNFLFVLI